MKNSPILASFLFFSLFFSILKINKSIGAAINRELEEEQIISVEPPGVEILRQKLIIKYPLSVVPLWSHPPPSGIFSLGKTRAKSTQSFILCAFYYMHGKTITTFLIDGSPTGVKTIELSGWIGKAIVVPRAKLKDIKNRPEMQQPGVYFLFGKDDNEADIAYIGETENLFDRIANHDTNKDFWEIAIAFTSKGNDLTKGDIKFLESRAIERAKSVKRFNLTNNTTPPRNNLPEYQQAAMEEFLENIDLLLAASGYTIIKDNNPDITRLGDNNIYILNTRGTEGKGIYTSDGFVIFAGSRGRSSVVASYIGKEKRIRTELKQKGIIREEGEEIIFLEDYLSSSPSFAASLLMGRSANGWTEWKMSNGKTLDEMERKSLLSES